LAGFILTRWSKIEIPLFGILKQVQDDIFVDSEAEPRRIH